MTRLALASLALPLFLAPIPVSAQPVVAPVGDGGSVGITVQNRSVHPLDTSLGPAAADGVELTLERYASGGFVAQCIAGARDAAPPLTVRVDGRPTAVDVPSIAFSDGPPALWISSQHGGRASLQAVVRGALPEIELRHLELAAVPETFAALRFARLILISAADFGRLAPMPRQALADAVAAGTTLVVDTGEAGAAPNALGSLLSVELGEVRRPTGALAAHLTRASARRALDASGRTRVSMTADGRPLVVEARHGLGVVRVIGVRFAELSDGALARHAFTPPAEPLGHVLRWLAQAPPQGEIHPSPFGGHIWSLLALLAGLLVLTRRRPRLALMLAVPWWLVALFVPPQWSATRLETARVLYVPVGGGALAVATLDLNLTRGGPRTLTVDSTRVALEDVSPGGACLVTGAGTAGWVVDGEAGTPRRLTVFAMLERMPEGADKIDELPSWPAGALAGATLRRVQDGPLPLGLTADRLDAVRVEPAPRAPTTPVELGAL